MANDATKVPEWVRLPDGSQVPFDADRICRSLFAASDALGQPNAFLARELTDAVVHFLGQDPVDTVPTTAELAEQIEKVVREVGHPALARRFAELQSAVRVTTPVASSVPLRHSESPAILTRRALETYSRSVVFSRDLHAALEEGLLHISGLASPATFTHYLLDARTLGGDSWWLHWEEWKQCGNTWVIDSPEWLSLLPADRSPMIRLCERIIALPRAARHAVELHLNVAEPPRWMSSQAIGPLFGESHDPGSHSMRFGLQDMIVEQCLATRDLAVPVLAWHLNEDSWGDGAHRARLRSLVRQAALGRPVRFLFDRPQRAIGLADGMDRKSSGVLCEISLDLPTFAARSDIAQDGPTLLAKLPSLARMAVSAVRQKQRYLRSLPDSPLTRAFVIERAVGVVTPLGLDAVVRSVTGESMTKSPLSLQFARQILQTIQGTLREASTSLSLDIRLDGMLQATEGDAAVSLRKQLETASQLHACVEGGALTLLLSDEADTNADTIITLLRWVWESMNIVRLQLRRAGSRLVQPEFPAG